MLPCATNWNTTIPRRGVGGHHGAVRSAKSRRRSGAMRGRRHSPGIVERVYARMTAAHKRRTNAPPPAARANTGPNPRRIHRQRRLWLGRGDPAAPDAPHGRLSRGRHWPAWHPLRAHPRSPEAGAASTRLRTYSIGVFSVDITYTVADTGAITALVAPPAPTSLSRHRRRWHHNPRRCF